MIEYPIYTNRLALRGYALSDLEDVLAYHSLEEVARYQFWTPRSREELLEKFAVRISETQITTENQNVSLVVEENDSGRVVGDVLLGVRDVPARQAEIGYSFHPDFQGRGYAAEAVMALLRLGFEELDLHRIYARCDARNDGSWKLAERLGMRREAHFRQHAIFKGAWDEEFYYAMLEDEWRARA